LCRRYAGVIWNPFEDIVPRVTKGLEGDADDASERKKRKKKEVKKLNLLSFGGAVHVDSP
jgi:peptidyl-prolyl cis-trans isomerase SDCCAG10